MRPSRLCWREPTAHWPPVSWWRRPGRAPRTCTARPCAATRAIRAPRRASSRPSTDWCRTRKARCRSDTCRMRSSSRTRRTPSAPSTRAWRSSWRRSARSANAWCSTRRTTPPPPATSPAPSRRPRTARALAPGDPRVQQATQEFIARLQAEAGKALSAGNPDQADSWTSAAAAAGAQRADVAALRAEAQRQRAGGKADSLARLALSFNERLAAGRITDPAADSAKFYLAQLLQADPDHPTTQLARTAFDTRVLDEARGALRAQDYALARRWLTEARAAGADPASIGTVETAIGAAQDAAQQASSYVSASSITRTRYVAPLFPSDASRRGIDGWVDLQFLVNTDGSVGELTIVGAQPVGIFEQAALDA